MGKYRQNSALLRLVIAAQVFSAGLCPVASAEPRVISAIAPSGSSVSSITAKLDSALRTSILRPTPLAGDEAFYRVYVAALDDRIEREYRDRWYFHDLQNSYGNSNRSDQKHVNSGTLEFHDNAASEKDYRRAFAMQVLQLRGQRAIQEYLKTWKGINGLKTVEQTFRALESARTQSISLGSAGSVARPNPLMGDIRFGYDIFTDFTKLEYSCRALDFGFYHTFFLGTVAGSNAARSFYSQLTVKTDGDLPTPSLRYRFEAQAVDLGLSKSLTKTLTGSLATSQPIARGSAPSYGVSFAYSF